MEIQQSASMLLVWTYSTEWYTSESKQHVEETTSTLNLETTLPAADYQIIYTLEVWAIKIKDYYISCSVHFETIKIKATAMLNVCIVRDADLYRVCLLSAGNLSYIAWN